MDHHHRDAKKEKDDPLTRRVIGCAIEVHRAVGPGLLENAYEECLCHELALAGVPFRRQVSVPLRYKGLTLACGYRLDLVVDNGLIVEIKAMEKLLPIHDAQLDTSGNPLFGGAHGPIGSGFGIAVGGRGAVSAPALGF